MFSGRVGGANEAVAEELSAATGAVLMGRRMFEFGIGPWADTAFPVPCFVLTHRAHEDLVMASGTFSFITDGLTAALDRARAAANGKNVLVHSADVAQQLLRAGLLEEIQLHLVPILLGAGRRLFDHIGDDGHEFELARVCSRPQVSRTCATAWPGDHAQ